MTEEVFEIPEFMSQWTESQRAEFTFFMLTTLSPYRLTQLIDRISPYIYRDMLCATVNILSFLDFKSFIQASQVCKGWRTLCDEPNLWKTLFENEGWLYDEQEIDAYLYKENIRSIPIRRSFSSPFIPRHGSAVKIKRMNQPPKISDIDERSEYHYDPVADKRLINWKRLYQNRFMVEQRWKKGFCMTRLFPSPTTVGPELHTEGIYCSQFDKHQVVTGSRDWTIKVWDAENERCKRTIRVHTGSVLCLQFDSTQIVSGSSDGTVVLTELMTGDVVHRLRGHRGSVLGVRFVQEKKIVSCSKDGQLRLWDRVTGKCLRIMGGHQAAINAVQCHENKLVSASGDRTLKIWNLETGECLRTLTGHTRGVACIEFDGQHIVSGSSDHTIKIWNADTGDCISTMMGHTELVRTLQFNANLNRVVSGCYNGHLKIWDLKKGEIDLDLRQTSEGRYVIKALLIIE
ncbi:hypothetical protein G6F60_006565 [Rhizopus arrhizus]|nr:hypothetical protein G6F60_006565 [Rhizopus arrhizus]